MHAQARKVLAESPQGPPAVIVEFLGALHVVRPHLLNPGERQVWLYLQEFLECLVIPTIPGGLFSESLFPLPGAPCSDFVMKGVGRSPLCFHSRIH